MDRFFDRLRAAASARDSLLCVGLDPEPSRIEGGIAGAVRHCTQVVKATSEIACAYKPNAAFWEQYGAGGWQGLGEVRECIPADIPVIFDVKRADVPNTMEAYARAAFDAMRMDAVTLHAYHGAESLAPFTERSDRGVYVVCRTSNPGARDLQEKRVDDHPLYVEVGEMARRVNRQANVGVVVGATAVEELRALRRRFPELPFLVPGVGAQGGDLEAAVRAAWTGDPASCLLSVSRSVLYDGDPARAAGALRERMRAVMATARPQA